MADVVIAGAGLSGLAAALRLTDAGKSVIVLEAREKAGGRMVHQQVAGGGWVDLGGQWVGRTQHNIRRIAHRLNIKLFKQYTLGTTRLSYGGVLYDAVESADGTLGRDGNDLKTTELLQSTLSDLAAGIPAKPWHAPRAEELDQGTLGQWIDQWVRAYHGNASSEYAGFFVGWDSRFNQSGGSPWEVSLLHSLFETKVNPADEDPDESLCVGGAGQIPGLLAGLLETRNCEIFTNSRVVAISDLEDGVQVTTRATGPNGTGGRFDGKFAIVAMPPFLTGAISYDPLLVAPRLQLVQRTPMGVIAKIACTYDTAWWRESGLSGTALGDSHRTVQAVADSGPLEGGPGILTSFVQGEKYNEWALRNGTEQRQMVLDDLAHYFGDEARAVKEYIPKDWPEEQLTGGAYNAYMPPGGWTQYGHALRANHGRIHWAGTETATEWYGYFDGAISAGEREADEILKKLG
ncbi:MAG TPA: FAD-dependent oxidoreductase [Streptosporangiaceae bacterium]|nr:FAD-dependent oxidoreductase [Streptosporangiaceae bacterium]